MIALALMLREESPVTAAALVEPPLLSLLPSATEGLSEDREAIAATAAAEGAAAVRLYLAGRLPSLGPGAERIPAAIAADAPERPLSLFAEIAAVADWPLRAQDMIEMTTPSRIVVGATTPPLLRAASEELSVRLGGSAPLLLGGEGLPHLSAASGLATAVVALLGGD